MKGVFPVSQQGHRLFSEEKGVADGAIADAPPFQPVQLIDGRHFPGGSGGEKNGAGSQLAAGGIHQKIPVPGEPHHLIPQQLSTQPEYLGLAVLHQLMTRFRGSQPKIIFNISGFFQSAVVLADDGDGKTCPQQIEGGRQSRRTISDNCCILYHEMPLLSEFPISDLKNCNSVTVQSSTIPRGVTLLLQRDPEARGRQAAGSAACVHAFVTVKPEG